MGTAGIQRRHRRGHPRVAGNPMSEGSEPPAASMLSIDCPPSRRIGVTSRLPACLHSCLCVKRGFALPYRYSLAFLTEPKVFQGEKGSAADQPITSSPSRTAPQWCPPSRNQCWVLRFVCSCSFETTSINSCAFQLFSSRSSTNSPSPFLQPSTRVSRRLNNAARRLDKSYGQWLQ